MAVAISGDMAVVGADWWEGSSGSNIGAAYVLERNENGLDGWGQVKRILPADGASGDFFGRSVVISGDTIVVGASGRMVRAATGGRPTSLNAIGAGRTTGTRWAS